MSALDALLSQAHVSDKIEHGGAYLMLALVPTLLWRDRKRVVAVLSGFALMGFLLEIAQSLVPGREPDWRDFVANVVGLLIGYSGGLKLRRRTRLQQLLDSPSEDPKSVLSR